MVGAQRQPRVSKIKNNSKRCKRSPTIEPFQGFNENRNVFPGLSLRSNPSMKPGRVKRNSGFDWFTLLFEFPRVSLRFSVVVSFNGATSLILGYEFCTQGCHEFLVISISFRTHPFSHSSLTRPSRQLD